MGKAWTPGAAGNLGKPGETWGKLEELSRPPEKPNQRHQSRATPGGPARPIPADPIIK